jgi:energy-coupling factor transporter ATP-binding protein EcfA2
MKAADLEAKFAEYDGYTAEARAGELLAGVGIPIAQHQGLMSSIAPGFKLRVLLAQALFSNPDILLLDEPTNNLDINTIRWLEDVLNQRNSTMIIISHDRHFLNQVCTHMADMDYGTLKVYPGNYDDYMLASTQARAQQMAANAKAKEKVAELQDFVRRFSANKSKARQATSRAKQIDKIKIDDFKPSSRQNPFIRFEGEKKLHRLAVETQSISKAYDHPLFKNFSIAVEAGEKIGYLPGTAEEKIHPYLLPILDEINHFIHIQHYNKLKLNNQIEIVPLGLMRGRSFHDSFIVADECQNATYDQLKMLLTRIGQNSKMVITGDIRQSDLARNLQGGYKIISQVLQDINNIGFSYLESSDIIRNPIIADIMSKIESYESNQT